MLTLPTADKLSKHNKELYVESILMYGSIRERERTPHTKTAAQVIATKTNSNIILIM